MNTDSMFPGIFPDVCGMDMFTDDFTLEKRDTAYSLCTDPEVI